MRVSQGDLEQHDACPLGQHKLQVQLLDNTIPSRQVGPGPEALEGKACML